MSLPSKSQARRVIETLSPERTVTALSTIEPGKNTIYAVSFSEGEAILKIGTASPGRVQVEPDIVQFVRDRTTVPAPEVLGAADDLLEYPCCLFERVPGHTVSDRSNDLEFEDLARLCEEGGRHLGTLHQTDGFGACGPLVAGNDGLTVAESDEDWPSLLHQILEAKLEELGRRFEQYRDSIRAYIDSSRGDCHCVPQVDPVFVHMDYRPANLVLGPSEPTITRAVLDWAGAAAAPAAYEIAHAEALLTDWPRLDADDQARLRERFYSGYFPTDGTPDIPDIYRVDARLRLMKHLELEVGDQGEASIVDRVDEHVDSLAALDVL